MSNKKMTKREMFNQLKSHHPLSAEEIAFIDHELELLDKKNSKTGEKKMTAQQIANAGIKEEILAFMREQEQAMTVSDIHKNCEVVADISPQRLTALIHQLVNAGSVERVEEKRKAYFKAIC